MAEGDIRTLVVDDSEFFADMTAETLTEEHDIEAVSVHGGVAATELLAEEEFDCVVSDYEMPDMDGLTLLSNIREEDPSLPFILLTGRGDEETASRAIKAGVADYLLKLEVVEDKQYGRLANRIESVVEQDRTNKKFESLVRNSPDGIAHVTEQGVVLSVNPAMAGWLGHDAGEITGERLTDLMETETARRRVAAARKAIDDGETIETEDSLDGRHYQNQFIPVESHRERATAQMVSRDVTDQVERQEELKRQNRRLEEFASVVSHDLRNPLNVARGALDLIDQASASEDDAEPLAKLDRSLTRMGELIEDVLTLAREGQAVDGTEAIDIETLATEVWTIVETGESALAVAWSATIQADPTRAQDLFANLFRNAVEHNEDAVTVTVGVMDGGFYVADDGTGVPTDENVFEMGHSSNDSGTGIGLAIVAQIADAHGWDVVITDSESGGARFELTNVD